MNASPEPLCSPNVTIAPSPSAESRGPLGSSGP